MRHAKRGLFRCQNLRCAPTGRNCQTGVRFRIGGEQAATAEIVQQRDYMRQVRIGSERTGEVLRDRGRRDAVHPEAAYYRRPRPALHQAAHRQSRR